MHVRSESRGGITGSVIGLKQSRVDVRDQLNKGQLKLAFARAVVQGSWRKDTKRKHAWPQLGGEETIDGLAAIGHDLGLLVFAVFRPVFGWTKQPAKWAENKTKLGLK